MVRQAHRGQMLKILQNQRRRQVKGMDIPSLTPATENVPFSEVESLRRWSKGSQDRVSRVC
jgi:hypothetical protein